MEDLQRNKKSKVKHEQNESYVEHDYTNDSYERKCNAKHNCECNCECTCNCNNNGGCSLDVDGDDCINNTQTIGCCEPLQPTKFNPSNVVLYPVEVDRIFDTIAFQTFTDPEEELDNELEVDEICGNCPCYEVDVTIDKVCLSYDEIEVEIDEEDTPTLDDYDVEPIEAINENTFECEVNGQLNKKCAVKCKGNPVCFKQRNIVVKVKGLSVQIKGSFGDSEFTASLGKVCKPVEFKYGKLTGEICCPANGKDFVLRQDIQTLLTIDCLGKAKLIPCKGHGGQIHYRLFIPGGLDLVCCLQDKVSILVTEQLSLVGSVTPIQPRIVDTFSSVCDFKIFEENCETPVKPKNNCGCK